MSLRNEIKAYLDGELDGDTALRVAQMLQSDEALRKEADDYRALSSTLRLVAEPDVATQGLENTLRALRMEKEPAKARAWWTGGWGYAMAGAAAILMVFLFFPHPKPDMFATDETKADSVAATASGHAEFAAPTAKMKSAVPGPSVADSVNTSAPSEPVPAPSAAGAAGGANSSFESAPYPDANPGAEATVTPTAPTAPPMDMAKPTANTPEKKTTATAERRAQPARRSQETRRSSEVRRMAEAPLPKASKPSPSAPVPHLVIQNGTLSIYVGDVPSGQSKVEGIAKNLGGYVANSNLLDNGNPAYRQATVTIRIPVTRFANALNAVRALGEVYQEQMSGQDVTAQVADTEGRLNSLRAEANQLRQLTNRANNVDEVLHVRDRLSQVDQEIAGMESQRSAMRDQAAMSTLTISLSIKPKQIVVTPVPTEPKSWIEQTFGDAADTFSNLFKMLFSLLAELLALSPIWVPILGLSYWAWRTSENKRGY